MRNGTLRGAVAAVVLGVPQLIAASARADIPAGYAGKPFDPAVAGGVGKIPPTVKAGPYPIPGRIDVVNYDLGGVNVAYNSGLHETNHGGNGYRTDTPAPTLCVTSQADKDVWYDTGAGLDGTFYPTATTQDFYVGAVQIGDWFNFTVNVLTSGTYSLSSTWATGNGPPGGEGGDGTMGLQVFVNGTMAATWNAIFPNYETEASYHNWRFLSELCHHQARGGPAGHQASVDHQTLQPRLRRVRSRCSRRRPREQQRLERRRLRRKRKCSTERDDREQRSDRG